MTQPPKIYTIHNGVLVLKNQNTFKCSQSQKIIKYSHTVQPSPDQYHTVMIKQYRQQNDELRKNYSDLEKAYYNLLGYSQDCISNSKAQENHESITIDDLDKDGISIAIRDGKTKNQLFRINQFDHDEALNQKEGSKIKQTRLTQSMLSQQAQIKQQKNCSTRRYVRTQIDENIQDRLLLAFKEIEQLKQLLDIVKQNCDLQVQKSRIKYEMKIQNLQTSLQKERKQSRMLNGVINRMRDELKNKDNFFRSIKEMRNGTEKHLLEKMLKQHKITI